jgi:hypothetical protein
MGPTLLGRGLTEKNMDMDMDKEMKMEKDLEILRCRISDIRYQ